MAGIGGTGVVTVGQLITMAAHLEGKGASVLDFTGFAQKGGAVLSHIRIGSSPETLHQVRIADGRADAIVACDVVVGTDPLYRFWPKTAAGLVNYTKYPAASLLRIAMPTSICSSVLNCCRRRWAPTTRDRAGEYTDGANHG